MIDFTKIKKLTIGGVELKQLFINGIQVWKAITFTNQVPISEDTTPGSIFNGVGYIENRRLSSSGGLSSSAQNGSVTTGFIPFPYGDETIIRMKGVEWLNAYKNYGGHHYVNFYDSSKKFLNYISSETNSYGDYSHLLTITRDANGIETVSFNTEYGTSNELLNQIRNKAKYIRITAQGKGANFITTINEEIT